MHDVCPVVDPPVQEFCLFVIKGRNGQSFLVLGPFLPRCSSLPRCCPRLGEMLSIGEWGHLSCMRGPARSGKRSSDYLRFQQKSFCRA